MTGLLLFQCFGALVSLSWGVRQFVEDEVDRRAEGLWRRCQRCDAWWGERVGVTGRWGTRLVCRRCLGDLRSHLGDGTLRLATPAEHAQAGQLTREQVEAGRRACMQVMRRMGRDAQEVSALLREMTARAGSHDVGRLP